MGELSEMPVCKSLTNCRSMLPSIYSRIQQGAYGPALMKWRGFLLIFHTTGEPYE